MSQRLWVFSLALCAATAASFGVLSLGWAIIPGGLKDAGVAVVTLMYAAAGVMVLAALRAPRRVQLWVLVGALVGAFIGFIAWPVLNIVNSFTTHLSPWSVASFLPVAAVIIGVGCIVALRRSGVFDSRAAYRLSALMLIGVAGLLPARPVVFTGVLESGNITFAQWMTLSVGLLCSVAVALVAALIVPDPIASPTEQALQPDTSRSVH